MYLDLILNIYNIKTFLANMINIKNKDTLIDIIGKIKDNKSDEIILNFPFWHQVLHNYLSLKILKSKSNWKRITILTTDLWAKRIWTKLGIYYSIIKDKDFFEENNIKWKILKENFTFFQYFIFELKKIGNSFKNFFLKYTRLEKLEYVSPYDKVKSSSLWIVFLWLFLASFLLVFVFYFAVNKTYIYITPEITSKIESKNFIFKELKWEMTTKTNIVDLKLKTNVIKLERTYNTTWVYFESTTRALWTVIFYNELNTKQTLKPKTRIVTNEWIIFETTDWVKIPRKTRDPSWNVVPWIAEITASAKIYDETGKFIWSRGNIKSGTLLTIINLRNKDKVYAKSKTDFSWWNDKFLKIIWENDIETFKKLFTEDIKKEALKKLKEKINSENKQNSVKYEILNIDWLTKFRDIKIKNVWEYKIWDKTPNIILVGEIGVSTYVYNKDFILSKLKKDIKDKILTWAERLVWITDNSLSIQNIVEKNEKNILPVKITMWVEARTSYDYNNNSSSDVLKIKRNILGLEKKEALNILLNNKKISNVEIKTVPFFLKSVSNMMENIIVKIKDN